ncbi:antiterminator Q family protein [Enterobacter hormaechei]|uniref:antiterminator Q family protein n=1 Tax=Enterobacter hormaechei TaxID=158836 RepID=UPI00084C0009|nr:antiterminator Q family protein [Enterobacter hormaechei]AOP90937.1 antitermination protein [Enterobacter hormaechei subsp. xiangfangensis]MDK3076796.1 antiterminator Q family protein [Enterobacter hormaechei]
MSDMYELMDRWGAWAAAENSGVDWPPVAAGFKGLISYDYKSRLKCTDVEGIVIDGCVAQLKKIQLEAYEIIIAHFVFGISLRRIAKNKKCSDGTIRKKLHFALGFLTGCYTP